MSATYPRSPSSASQKFKKNEVIRNDSTYDRMEIDEDSKLFGVASLSLGPPPSIPGTVRSSKAKSHQQPLQNERFYNKSNELQEQYQPQQAQGFANYPNVENKKSPSTSQGFYTSDLNMSAFDINLLVEAALSQTSLDPEVVRAAAQLFQLANETSRHSSAAGGPNGYYVQTNTNGADAVSRPSAMSLSNLLLPDDSGSSSQATSEKKLFQDEKVILSFN